MQLLTMQIWKAKDHRIAIRSILWLVGLMSTFLKQQKKPHMSFDKIMASGTVIDSVEQKEWGVAPELSSPQVKQSSHMWNFNGSYRWGAGQ